VQKLRIALIAPPWFAVPPAGYGGIEWVVSNLAEGLVRDGHDVTLFASGGSRTQAGLVSTYGEPPSAQLGDWMVEGAAVAEAYARHDEFDIIHDHSTVGTLCAAGIQTPVVHTVHGLVTPDLARLYSSLRRRLHFIAISNDQRSTLPAEVQSTVLFNGIDTLAYPFDREGGDHLVFVGRINPDKGIMDALAIAERTGKPLMVLAKINESNEREYYDEVVKPALRGRDVEFIEHATHDQKVRAYQGALATLFPIHWREPFGLVMAESMSCGTPVIAFRHGSVPEVIVEGETGFIRDDVDGAVEAVSRAHLLRRDDCRARALMHFSADRMVTRHEQLYASLVAPQPATVVFAPTRSMVAAAS
jgi:glycosyltransferase involved in cell wall biosynthesis